jgi:ABC-type transport system involved in cytochrome bd biosynthesis fused ATPase/permease subunit
LPLAKTDALVGSYLTARNKHFKVLLVEYGVILTFKVLIIAALLIIGSLLVFANQLNVGQFVAMEIVVILLLSAVEKLILSVENIYDVLTALEKIGSVTDLPLESELGVDVPSIASQKGLLVSLKDVSLQFPDQRYAVLQSIDLELKAGSRTNIVTTDDSFIAHFFRLLSGFYNGYDGSISFNGLPLQNIQLENLRRKVGGYSTLQEIFEGTLLENITLGINDVSIDRVLALITSVGLDAFLAEERLGLQSPLQSGVNGLPEIVRRKIILARSLATHPDLLLLNQPFEGLSSTEKSSLVGYLDTYMPNSTVILATFREEDCDFGTQTYYVHNHSIQRTSPQKP